MKRNFNVFTTLDLIVWNDLIPVSQFTYCFIFYLNAVEIDKPEKSMNRILNFEKFSFS